MTSAPSAIPTPAAVDDAVPAPRRPGKGAFRWSDVVLPVVIGALAFGAVLLFEIRGTVPAAASIVVFVILAIALGRRIGLRAVRFGWLSDLYRGALTAELLALGLAAIYISWSEADGGGYDAKGVGWALVFAHVIALPPLLCGAAFGVSLGVGTRQLAGDEPPAA